MNKFLLTLMLAFASQYALAGNTQSTAADLFATDSVKKAAPVKQAVSVKKFTKTEMNARDKANLTKSIVEHAVFMAVTQGRKVALAAISDPKGIFIKDEFYAFAGDLKTITLLAHPYIPSHIGTDMGLFNDGNGTYMNFEMSKIALENGAGWVDYYWFKPGSGKKLLKHTYVMKVPTQSYFIGSGYYE